MNSATPPAAHPPGTVLQGRYEVGDVLGQGGMGVVYQCADRKLNRRAVAIKALFPGSGLAAADALRRFEREAMLASSLSHPHIAQVFDYFVEDEQPYLVMELVEGPTLEAVLRVQGALPAPQAVAILRQLALALGVAHGQRVVHRDIKPANLKLLPHPQEGSFFVKVLDFGIARPIGGDQDPLTQEGAVLGTPEYMAPEQVSAQVGALTGATDLYAAGVVFYQMLTGALPFRRDGRDANDWMRVCLQHLTEPPPSLPTHVPAPLRQITLRLLAKRPAERFPDAVALLQALEAPRASWGLALVRASQRPWIATAALLCLLTGLAWRLTRAPNPQRARDGAALPPRAKPLRSQPAPWSPAAPNPPGMVAIPGGAFLMGTTPAQVRAAEALCTQLKVPCPAAVFAIEQPTRRVPMDPFYSDRAEVSNEDFVRWLNQIRPSLTIRDGQVLAGEALLLDAHVPESGIDLPTPGPLGRFTARPRRADLPAVGITWSGARRYCQAQGKQLPSEAQWEYLARGTQGRLFPWGDAAPTCDAVVFGREAGCSRRGPGPVGEAAGDVTPEGVRGLGGNVAEWVEEWFTPRYPTCVSGCSDTQTTMRVIRGGDWSSGALLLRGARRRALSPAAAKGNVGLRCVKARPPG